MSRAEELAKILETLQAPEFEQAATELRRLQAENDRMASELARPVSSEVSTLLAERAQLLAENAELKKDAERVDWLTGTLFVGKWNGVIDGGKKVTWSIPGDWRHTCATMVGDDLRTAIDAAMRAADAAMKGKP